MADEQFRYDILINAKAAIKELREMSVAAQSNAQRIQEFSSFLVEKSKQWNVPVKELLNTFRQLNAEMAKAKGPTIFGNVGGQNIFNMSEEFLKSAEAAGRFKTNAQGIVTTTKATAGGMGELASGTEKAWGQFEILGQKVNFVRTAFGTLEAIGIFNVIQLITGAFREATTAAKELEDSLYRISNTERILSQQGIEVSVKGLEEGIKRIKKQMPIFSKEDITGVVGQLAITTQGMGFTEKQILDLAQAITVLNVNSAEAETLQATTQHVISSLITDNARGVANLGLDMSKASVEAKAVQMNLLVPGESIESLSEYEKNMVKAQIAIDKAADSMGSLNDYMKTNTARAQENAAAYHDMLTTWGSLLNYLTPVLTGLYGILTAAGNSAKALYILGTYVKVIADAFFVAVTGANNLYDAVARITKISTQLPGLFDRVAKSMLKNLFPEGMPDNAPKWFQNLFGNIFKEIEKETPTAPHAGLSQKEQEEGQKLVEATQKTEDEIAQIMQDAADKRADIERQYQQKLADIALDNRRKLEDITRETAQKREDAQRNYSQKVEDINRDANEKVAEANRDAKQKEIDREKEFQEKLRELREKFLFDLEDALRERDARQVLRLIRQYAMDKKNLEERRKLDQKQAKVDLAQKLADIERERQLKLQAAQRELAEKQAEIDRWAARERQDAQIALQRKLADARIWHQRELADYQRYLQQKLQALAQSIVKEYQLTAAGAAAIYNLLNSYYGTNGSIPNLLTQGLQTNLNGVLSSGGGSNPLASPSWAQAGFFGAAEGGTFVATRPTKLLVGEKGAESVSITPLTRSGADTNKIFSNAAFGSTSMGGSLSLRIAMSDGLIAEIVETSLDNVASTIERIRREK